jgi:hypothetical protein
MRPAGITLLRSSNGAAPCPNLCEQHIQYESPLAAPARPISVMITHESIPFIMWFECGHWWVVNKLNLKDPQTQRDLRRTKAKLELN